MNFVQTIPSRVLSYLRSYLATAPGISPVAKYARSEPNSEYELRAYLQRRNDWSDKVYDSISWPAYRSSAGLTDNLRTFVVKLVMAGYPLAYANDDAVVR
jgi:hypothetical protein